MSRCPISTQRSARPKSWRGVSWGGLSNTYYWLDPAQRVTGLLMTQILPFADHRALQLYGQFKRGVYDMLQAV